MPIPSYVLNTMATKKQIVSLLTGQFSDGLSEKLASKYDLDQEEVFEFLKNFIEKNTAPIKRKQKMTGIRVFNKENRKEIAETVSEKENSKKLVLVNKKLKEAWEKLSDKEKKKYEKKAIDENEKPVEEVKMCIAKTGKKKTESCKCKATVGEYCGRHNPDKPPRSPKKGK
jgi:hypothetical protein